MNNFQPAEGGDNTHNFRELQLVNWFQIVIYQEYIKIWNLIKFLPI